MHHDFISYSSADRASVVELVRSLRQGGRSVWVDYGTDTEPTASEAGIPAGQAHWDTILSAIQGSDSMVVFLTEQWLASDYCRREARAAHDLGKRIFILQDAGAPDVGVPADLDRAVLCDDLPSVLAHLEAKTDVTQAHTRLVVDMSAPGTDRSSWRELFLGVDGAADALLLATEDLPLAGLSLNSDQRARVSSINRSVGRRRRNLRTGWLTVTGILVVGLVLSVMGERSAAADSQRREIERSQAEGQLLAAQSVRLAGSDTPAALDMAERGLSLVDSRETRSALSQVRAAADVGLALSGPGSRPITVAVSDDGSKAAVGTDQGVFLIDTASGRQRFITSPGPADRLILADDGRDGALVTGGKLFLFADSDDALIPFQGDAGGASGTSPILDLALDGQGFLWWTTAEGSVQRAPREALESTSETVVPESGVAKTALSLDESEGSFAVLTDSGTMETYGMGGAQLSSVPIWPTNLAAGVRHGSYRVPTVSREYLVRCDKSWQLATSWFSPPGQAESNRALVAGGSALISPELSSTQQGIVCVPNGGSWGVRLYELDGSLPWPPTSRTPSELVATSVSAIAQSRRGKYFAMADDAGTVLVRQTARSGWGRTESDVLVALRAEGGTVLLASGGAIRFAGDSGEATTQVGTLSGKGEPSAWLTDSSGRAFFAAGSQLHEIGATGLLRTWDLGDDVGRLALREIAPGRLMALVPGRIGLVSTTDSSPIEWATLPPTTGVEGYLSADVDTARDRALVASNIGRVQLLELSTGRPLAEFSAKGAGPTYALFSPADDAIIVGGSAGVLSRLNLDLEPLDEVGLGSPILSMRKGPDGKVLVGLERDSAALLVDADTLESIRTVQSVAQRRGLDGLGTPEGGVDALQRIDYVVPNRDWSQFVAAFPATTGGVWVQTVP